MASFHNRQRTARRTVNNTGLRAVPFSPQETLYAIHTLTIQAQSSGGSSSGGGSSSDRDNSGSTGKVETTTKPDGTKVQTETKKDGT